MASQPDTSTARVTVALAVYNGARHLQRQLDSLAAQTVAAVDVWASDDGSSDGSRAILQDNAARWSKGAFTVVDGPRCGFAENFRSMITDPRVGGDHVAFCDQDDVWEPDKLARALAYLATRPAGRPALHCSRTLLIDEEDRPIGHSTPFARPPSFRNALVQSIAGANTMVMNRPAWELLRTACARTGFVSHDWWAYMIVSGAGGDVFYAQDPDTRYRQHKGNSIGENTSLGARLSRVRRVMAGRFREWNTRNLAGLASCADLLTPEARAVVERYAAARHGPPHRRVAALGRSGVYRQTRGGQAGLYVAALLNRL